MAALLRIVLLSVLFVAIQCTNWIKEMENEGLFQGDIALDPDEHIHLNGTRVYASIKGGRWPKGRIPYRIEKDLKKDALWAINRAIENYHKYTCLRFFKQTTEKEYISFYRGAGCHGPIGFRPGRVNRISIGHNCDHIGVVMHEMGHSMGFWHEHMRPDRDEHIKILWDNIRMGMQFQFDKLGTDIIDSLGTPYDYESMMHYGRHAFSTSRNKLTIVTLDPSKQKKIGQSNGFSKIDALQLNLMYKNICTSK